MKGVVINILCLLILISCNAQDGGEAVSNKCLEIKIPPNWQVDAFDKSSEKFLLVISEKEREIDRMARMEIFKIEANENEELEVAFDRLTSWNVAVDSVFEKSTISTNNLGVGFCVLGHVFFQPNRVIKAYYFSDRDSIIIIYSEYPVEESLRQEQICDNIIKTLVSKC
ncbi:hypothetical protein JMN32_21015 [Fulvivirga sp. 29W222]|uniref:Uncharacterized protein n=1 Tax=Fulvivirga marina TaxID=2494733 RepID=A0A937G243_9BACT|nr:hypothetical protein [Fulvivirga marina]MBL6448806.1 hypothetical protein [Fulvivirga marina]